MAKNWIIYIRDGFVYIATPALTDAGFYISVDPVAVVKVSDEKEMKQALKEALVRESPKIPTPTRDSYPEPVVLKYAGVKSWSSFHKTASCWVISKRSGFYEIEGSIRDSRGKGWEGDPDKKTLVPEEKGLDEVARVFIEQVKAEMLA